MRTRPILLLFATLLVSARGVASSEAPTLGSCGIGAAFFDLGDTLVENDGSGTFVTREGVPETIAGLQSLGVRLGIITNVPEGWTRDDLEAILDDPGLLDDFEVVVLSSEAPASKPDPAIYLHAHGLMVGAPPIAGTAFVGETLAEIADLEIEPTSGARSVGMIGIHLSDDPPSPLADATIPTADLPSLVGIAESEGQPVFCDGFESGETSTW